ncbi:uncharacterized protein LOC122658205 [Telopea speciosissima]|uniref:uncharacterized protein LOC122658205 n=1 Tax=Telopea speciosissima TaxID=54955 RepID=UPI001CC4E41A|nr:uncharacterized protein LOC122658205 [Telopea speciosissima]
MQDVAATFIDKPPSMINHSQGITHWTPPIKEYVKLNSDGAFIKGTASGYGALIRDDKGFFLVGVALKDIPRSVLYSECAAMRLALLLALELEIHDLVVESDCADLIKYARHLSNPPWEILLLMQDIWSFLSHFHSVIIMHVVQSTNSSTHLLAAFGTSFYDSSLCKWVGMPPYFPWDVLELDRGYISNA